MDSLMASDGIPRRAFPVWEMLADGASAADRCLLRFAQMFVFLMMAIGCNPSERKDPVNDTLPSSDSNIATISSSSTVEFLPNERQLAERLQQMGAEFGQDSAGAVTRVNLFATGASDNDLKQLVVFKTLHTLLLPVEATDASLAELVSLTQLEVLHTPPDITDAGLAHVAELVNLQELHMYGSKRITDMGLRYLQDLTRLEYVGLQNTNLTGAGIVFLRELDNLKWLSLSFTRTSDVEVVHLSSMTQLRGVSLYGTDVSSPTVTRLQDALPQCVVMYR